MGLCFPQIMHGLVPTTVPLLEKMRLAGQMGYHGLGVAVWDLESFKEQHGDLAQIKALSQQLGLPVTEFCCIVDGWADPNQPARQQTTDRFGSAVDLAHAAGCRTVSIGVPLQSTDLAQTAAAFCRLAEYTRQLDMQLGLEFVGNARQINSVAAAWQFIESTGADNAGLIIDSFHFFAGPSRLEDLQTVPPSRIFAVHLADAPANPPDPALDADRSMPGEGQLPLVPFVAALAGQGYDGYWHLECIQPRDFADDFTQVAQRGYRAITQVVEAATH